MKAEIYLKDVMVQVPRLLGLQNRNPMSRTFGCFDRQYWHYKTADFSCARSQEAVLTLALLYELEIDDNPYFKSSKILDWINSGLEFWMSIQEKNGSFNEWYPRESSFVATAFSTYAVSETLLMLGYKITEKEDLINALKAAGKWISKVEERRAFNQNAGAAMSLYNIYLLTREKVYRKFSEERIRFLINSQTEEGWFWEYGGADIGYLSLSIDYLAKYYQKTGNKDLLENLKKTVAFLTFSLHPNLTSGGEYGSRNTEYLIPHGFEILSHKMPEASLVARHIRNALEKKTTISLSSLDDRYLTYISYTYLQAYMESTQLGSDIQYPHERRFIKDFPTAGLWLCSSDALYVIINYRKGGACRIVFRRGNSELCDSGIILEGVAGKRLISGQLTNSNQVKIEKNVITVQGFLSSLPDSIMTPSKSILLRAFQSTLGRTDKIGLFVKEKARNLMITNASQSNQGFTRKFNICDDKIVIEDCVENKGTKRLIVGAKASYVYVPSSRYFQISELNSKPVVYGRDVLPIAPKEIKLVREYDIDGKLIMQALI